MPSREETIEAVAQPPSVIPAADEGAAPNAEGTLLLSLRRDRGELEKLLAECSNHWGYEDPVYRFYHQSFRIALTLARLPLQVYSCSR
jgi:hypothetical protein